MQDQYVEDKKEYYKAFSMAPQSESFNNLPIEVEEESK